MSATWEFFETVTCLVVTKADVAPHDAQSLISVWPLVRNNFNFLEFGIAQTNEHKENSEFLQCFYGLISAMHLFLDVLQSIFINLMECLSVFLLD